MLMLICLNFSSSLRGLESYQEAIDAGMNGYDCALLYDQCPSSYFGYDS